MKGIVWNYSSRTEKDILKLLQTLESETSEVLTWFKVNEMKSNNDKCHLIVPVSRSRNYSSNSYIYLGNEFLENEKEMPF